LLYLCRPDLIITSGAYCARLKLFMSIATGSDIGLLSNRARDTIAIIGLLLSAVEVLLACISHMRGRLWKASVFGDRRLRTFGIIYLLCSAVAVGGVLLDRSYSLWSAVLAAIACFSGLIFFQRFADVMQNYNRLLSTIVSLCVSTLCWILSIVLNNKLDDCLRSQILTIAAGSSWVVIVSIITGLIGRNIRGLLNFCAWAFIIGLFAFLFVGFLHS